MLDQLKERALDDHKNFWPVARWQPERDEDISSDLCLQVVSVQSVVAFGLLAVASAASGQDALARFGSYFAVVALFLFATFYALMRFGLARAWNRRAAQLRGDN